MSDIDCPFCKMSDWIEGECYPEHSGDEIIHECDSCHKKYRIQFDYDPRFYVRKDCALNGEKHIFTTYGSCDNCDILEGEI